MVSAVSSSVALADIICHHYALLAVECVSTAATEQSVFICSVKPTNVCCVLHKWMQTKISCCLWMRDLNKDAGLKIYLYNREITQNWSKSICLSVCMNTLLYLFNKDQSVVYSLGFLSVPVTNKSRNQKPS